MYFCINVLQEKHICLIQFSSAFFLFITDIYLMLFHIYILYIKLLINLIFLARHLFFLCLFVSNKHQTAGPIMLKHMDIEFKFNFYKG